jgi:hypothetical protein
MSDVWWSILIFAVFTLTAAVLAGFHIHHKETRRPYLHSASLVKPRVVVPAEEPRAGCPTTMYTYVPTSRDYSTAAGVLIMAAVAAYYLIRGRK